MPTGKPIEDVLYERVLVGDGFPQKHIEAGEQAVSSAREDVKRAIAASPPRGGPSLASIVQRLDVASEGERAIAAQEIVRRLNGHVDESAAKQRDSDAVSYTDVMTVLNELKEAGFFNKWGFGKQLAALNSTLHNQ